MKKVSKAMAAKKPMMKKGGAVSKPLAKKQKGGMSPVDKAFIRTRASVIKFGNSLIPGAKQDDLTTANEKNILMNDKNLAKNRANAAKVEANKRKVKENKQQVKVNAIKKKYKL